MGSYNPSLSDLYYFKTNYIQNFHIACNSHISELLIVASFGKHHGIVDFT